MKKNLYNLNRINLGIGNNKNEISKILKRSTRATCGPMEREIIVKDKNLISKIKTLKKHGYKIIGTGEAGFKKKKVWFNPEGLML